MKIQRRMAFHFTYQLIFYSFLIFAVILILFIFFIQQITNDEIRRNFPNGALDTITTEATYEKGQIKLASRWTKLLEERNIWMQIVNQEGKVIYKANADDSSLPLSYSVTQLLAIQETGEFGRYSITSQLDLTYKEPLLFLLGYENPDLDQLSSWYTAYQVNGLVGEKALSSLDQKLQETDSYLQIINQAGEIVQTVGHPSASPKKFDPLEIIAMQQAPGNYDTNIVVYRHAQGAMTWILHTPNAASDLPKQPILSEIIRLFIWMIALVLVLSIAVSFWHGYRYGQPLILFAGWFERMGRGKYDEVLTAKDKRRVFRRNGKLRIRYRLYREVIQAFYQMAERLAHTEKERKRLEKAQEEWMSGISHDLRTPLATIQGYGYMLESAPDQWSQEELRVMGTMIREKGDYMLELITDFSLINQLKQDGLPMEVQQVNLDELVRVAVLKYVNDATLADCHFIYEGEEAPITIQGNDTWLQRLLDNLLSNAVKHNPPGITVTVSAGMMNDEAYIRISDNGNGMDEETKRNLFERYYRGTNTEESTAGSGLGMSIAKAIVEAHGGEIEVLSSLGSGTEITIRLPQ
ncbi:HAMP domain-containing sensor histidine kinase [Paenibacillus mendelii]|uniref:histidine kinase n=1 Tax=Paenibacillus mendelii TaxID=206163 RepID=A0ABV6JIF8_9BACL|nr:HAMP domain-containing sensor histidine kinase [Paenibacillus mendelii]MCQ6563234.1 HAMP domain-containing histidine kinase [Paenibacillus mendelii]